MRLWWLNINNTKVRETLTTCLNRNDKTHNPTAILRKLGIRYQSFSTISISKAHSLKLASHLQRQALQIKHHTEHNIIYIQHWQSPPHGSSSRRLPCIKHFATRSRVNKRNKKSTHKNSRLCFLLRSFQNGRTDLHQTTKKTTACRLTFSTRCSAHLHNKFWGVCSITITRFIPEGSA